jgi:hypothetical protein
LEKLIKSRRNTELLYSPYFLAARLTIRLYNKDGRGNPYAARQRLEGVRDSLRYALMREKDSFQFEKLNDDLKLITKWIDELKADHNRLFEENQKNLAGLITQ